MASTYVFRTSELPKLDLDVDRGADFKAWHQQWLAYHSLSGLNGESPAKQVQALQLCFSRDILNIVDNLGLTANQRQGQAQIMSTLKAYVDGHVNKSVERSMQPATKEPSTLTRHSTTSWLPPETLPKPAISVAMNETR